MMVSSMCILFYRDDEVFDIIGANVRVSSNKKCITKLECCNWKNNTYGILEIPSMSDFIYNWDLKINNNEGIMIGISSVQCPSHDFEKKKNGHHYVYWHNGDIYNPYEMTWDNYGDRYRSGDIVSMNVDLREKQIIFSINGKDQGVAYDYVHQDEDVKYRLMVAMHSANASVEIVNFSKM